MNLFGKMITVVILIVSIIMMTLSVTVYSTHKNWQSIAKKYQKQLNDERNKNGRLTSLKESLDGQLDAEKTARQQVVAKLESERNELLSQNSIIQQDLDQLRQISRANTAALESTQANNEKLTAEVEAYRADIGENQEARDKAYASLLKATDELHQAKGKVRLLTQQNAQLAQDLGTKVDLLRSKGIDPNTAPDEIVPTIRGVVSAMHRTAGTQLIEITIGADDGLKKGHTVEVFRGQRYLGRAEIMRTEPDKAVGRVLRQFQQGQIKEDDNVATRLRIG